MPSKKLNQNPNEQFNKSSLITQHIGGFEIALNRKLFFYERGTDNLYSVVLIEGHSKAYNFIYGRIERGYPVGIPLPSSIPGAGAVCLLPSHLEAFEITCASN